MSTTSTSLSEGKEKMRDVDSCDNYVTRCCLSPSLLLGDVDVDVVSYTKANELSNMEKKKIFMIFETNMREMYEQVWGWNRRKKWNEMFSEKSHYLILKTQSSTDIVAYTHFQTVWDDEDEPHYPVLYCFELQVCADMQGKGVGRFLMLLLAKICQSFALKKLMLTVFQSNEAAVNFYKRIGFEVDESDPSNFNCHDEEYMIMSSTCDQL